MREALAALTRSDSAGICTGCPRLPPGRCSPSVTETVWDRRQLPSRRSSVLTFAVDAVWKARRAGDVVLSKTLLYAGVRVAELVRIRLTDVDLDACRIRISQGKARKDRIVPFSAAFKESLTLHIDGQRHGGAAFLVESNWKKPYSERGVRKILARYTQAAGITASISPHKLRHFLFTWLKRRGVASDATFREKREDNRPALQLPRPSQRVGRSASNAAMTCDVITPLHQPKGCCSHFCCIQ